MTWTLNWPAAILILGIVAFIIFRIPLSNLINRIRRLSKSGIEADAPPQQSQQKNPEPSATEQLQRYFDSQLLLNRETQLRTSLEQLKFKDSEEKEKWLIRVLAAIWIGHTFENTYAFIWGSQLELLQFLNSAGNTGVDISSAQNFYDLASITYPSVYAAFTLDQWLGFLQSHLLINKIDNSISITLEGREFLKYLVQQGYTLSKSG